MGQIIHQSVSGIIKSPQSVFVVRRSTEQRYFPGFWSFPGGKVSKIDGDKDQLRCALIRELKEELHFDFSLNDLNPVDTVTTPECGPYRFENHFFVIEIENEVEFKIDSEHDRALWLPFNKVESFLAEASTLAVPAFFWYMANITDGSIPKFQNQFLAKSKNQILKASYHAGVMSYMVPSLALPPSKHTNILLLGGERKMIVDPSPREEFFVEALIEEFQQFECDSIFISHWHPDHHQFSKEIAKELNLPIRISELTYNEILKRWGESYFENVPMIMMKDGDRISLAGVELIVCSHEGHASGQLGIKSQDESWVFVSDIFQGVGSVVVDDMVEYMKTLESLMSYSENTIFIPSHGFPIGGTGQLKRLYDHRLEREEQVRVLSLEGLSPEDILDKLYPHISITMKPYALKNIHGHILRIKNSIS